MLALDVLLSLTVMILSSSSNLGVRERHCLNLFGRHFVVAWHEYPLDMFPWTRKCIALFTFAVVSFFWRPSGDSVAMFSCRFLSRDLFIILSLVETSTIPLTIVPTSAIRGWHTSCWFLTSRSHFQPVVHTVPQVLALSDRPCLDNVDDMDITSIPLRSMSTDKLSGSAFRPTCYAFFPIMVNAAE